LTFLVRQDIYRKLSSLLSEDHKSAVI
jgi:hypothetical protein